MKTVIIAAFCAAAAPLAGAATSITLERAVDSLYSRMSLPDSLDYPREFFVRSAESTLRARAEMPWGRSVSESDFFDFILPLRTNNEMLDDSRMVFYEELAPRLRGMTMEQAALEVNHWAHEKATYRPSDGRTSSPMATVKTSWGRCGEESAFVCAAMRAVSIPARQVYTPRWAHTDDNHAWVEVLIDGRWQFLGGCEPEPKLNMAWFNAPAARGMLMETRTDGRYSGTEEVLVSSPYYTLVNVTPNYAPTAPARVLVTDADGKPLKGATVMYCLYNYAEFYPIATRVTDDKGRCEVTIGLGDLVIWVRDGDLFGLKKMNVGRDRNFTIIPDRRIGENFTVDFDLIPPAPSGALPTASAEAVAENDRRKVQEDSIRNAYMATFVNEVQARDFAKKYGYDADFLAAKLPASYGNHKTLTDFLIRSVSDCRRAETLLRVISDKDLRDITGEVLDDAFLNTSGTPDDFPLWAEGVLSPRISTENIVPTRAFFQNAVSSVDRKRFRNNPQTLVNWVKENIAVSTEKNPRNLRISPVSVWRHRRDINPASRDIFFVALARALAIPARINPVTGATEYSADGSSWTKVSFDSEKAPQSTVNLTMTYTPNGLVDDPKYYATFALSRVDGERPRQLEYDEMAPWSTLFKNGSEIEPGYYMLVSGQRLADGGVLARARFFEAGDRDLTLPLEVRSDTTQVQVIGSFNSENIYHDIASNEDKSILSTTGRGYFVVGIIRPGHEPSSHALNDIAAAASDLEKSGVKILLLFPDASAASRFDRSSYGSLPSNVVFGIDSNGQVAADLASNMKANLDEMPVFVVADTFNRVVFLSEGYTIHLGQKIADLLKRL